jgi:hypothetical protein
MPALYVTAYSASASARWTGYCKPDREAGGGPRLPRQLGTVGWGRALIMESDKA